jgi:hypothetical protein
MKHNDTRGLPSPAGETKAQTTADGGKESSNGI